MDDKHDLYPGEIKDLILAILSDSLDSFLLKLCCEDAIRDILRINEFKKWGKDHASKVKVVLKNYRGMTSIRKVRTCAD